MRVTRRLWKVPKRRSILPLALRSRGDQMGDFQGSQGALELALWIAVVAAGARSEKTEGVGVNGAGNAVPPEQLYQNHFFGLVATAPDTEHDFGSFGLSENVAWHQWRF